MKYTLYDFSKTPRDERPHYIEFIVTDGEIVSSFFTNRDGDGKFYQLRDGTYHPVKGTSDFSVNASKSTQRRRLREELEEDLERCF